MTDWDDWTRALAALTTDPEARRRFRERRFALAYQIGTLLKQWVASSGGDRPIIYAVALADGKPIYIGQTPEPSRRLYDLPIGESHHLANTFPPELWRRVIVLDWLALAKSPSVDPLPPDCDSTAIGTAIELHLQRLYQPEMNMLRKSPSGAWVLRNLDSSRSRAAGLISTVSHLLPQVERTFEELLQADIGPSSVQRSAAGCVVFPQSGVTGISEVGL
jgi:hypothetical protein